MPLSTERLSVPGRRNSLDLSCKMGSWMFGIRLRWMLVELYYGCVLFSVAFITAFFSSVKVMVRLKSR